MPKSEQGVTSDRYAIIPRTLIFLTRGEEILLLRGAPHKRLWANKYNGIGGHIERGEDALSSARRELAEEAGLAGMGLRLVGTVLIDAGAGRGIGLFVFRGEYAGGDLRASEEGSLEWVPARRLGELALVEDLRVLLPRILAMSEADAPFSALYYYDEQDQMQIKFGEEKD
jgi:8-oxo-dGTP diphosphatase